MVHIHSLMPIMNIMTAIDKLDNLSDHQLKLMIQQCQADIVNYKKSIKNYSEAKMKKYGIPYLNKLEKRKMLFENKLYKV